MTVNLAIEQLLEIEASRQQKLYSENTIVIGLARVGSDDQRIVAGTMEELLIVEFGLPLHSFIIPGKMHFLEAEAVREFALDPETFDRFAEITQH